MKTKQTFFLVALAAFNIAAAQNENDTVYLLAPITSITDSGVSTFKPATECKIKSHNGDNFVLVVGETELTAKQSDITLNKAQADNAAAEFKAKNDKVKAEIEEKKKIASQKQQQNIAQSQVQKIDDFNNDKAKRLALLPSLIAAAEAKKTFCFNELKLKGGKESTPEGRARKAAYMQACDELAALKLEQAAAPKN